MNEKERERIIALLARIGAEMEDASAVAIGAALLYGEELSLALSALLNSISRIQSMSQALVIND